MPSSRIQSIARVTLLAVVLLPLSARGQYGVRPPEVKPEQLNATGTIKAIRPGLLHVLTEDNDQWLIQVRARPQDIAFTGPADSSFLKPGMLVRFVGKFNKRGECVEPVGSVTIFTIREGHGLGIKPDAEPGLAGTKEFFSDAKLAEKPAGKKDEAISYRVAGTLTKLSRSGEMTISAPGATIKADLADDANISVDINNLSYVREGDQIEVRGQYLPAQKGQAVANWISVTAKEPLADAKKKPSAATPALEKPGAAKPSAEKTEKPAEGDEK